MGTKRTWVLVNWSCIKESVSIDGRVFLSLISADVEFASRNCCSCRLRAIWRVNTSKVEGKRITVKDGENSLETCRVVTLVNET